MEELNLKELFSYLLRKWFIMVIAFVILLVGGITYTFGFKIPMYSSSTTIVLTRQNEGDAEITTSQVQLNKQLISSYREIIKSKKVLGQVINELKLDYSINTLKEMVSIGNVSDTELIEITVNSKKKQQTAKIANKISEIFEREIKDIYNIENVKTVDVAEMSKTPYNINVVKDILIFSVIGIVLGSGVVFVMFYFDTNIKTTEEVEAKTGLPILGNIPVDLKRKKGGLKK